MAVRIPNLGTGNGQTGDNEFKIRSDYNHNFTDRNNAASRLVGEASGNVMEVGAFGWGTSSVPRITNDSSDASIIESLYARGSHVTRSETASTLMYRYGPTLFLSTGPALGGLSFANSNSGDIKMFSGTVDSAADIVSYKIYTSDNTTTDSNGFIKAASPIVKVFADKVELNTEATDQDVTFIKNGIGDYTITTVSGLSTDGWYIELPKDINGNPKLAVTLTEADGIISLKCYKRIFSMETFTFVPDLDEPMDVHDGRWIDLRLNEQPQEPMPEPMSEV